MTKSEDPHDNLDAFATYLHDNIGSTTVYIGQLEPPRKECEDDADENDHLDRDSPEIIKIKFSKGDYSDVLINSEIKEGQGLTHPVFNE